MTVEERLRGALSARATQVTVERLQPALPPTLTAPSRRRPLSMVWWVPVAAALAAVAVIVTVLLGGRPVADLPASPGVSQPPPGENVKNPPGPAKAPQPGLKAPKPLPSSGQSGESGQPKQAVPTGTTRPRNAATDPEGGKPGGQLSTEPGGRPSAKPGTSH
jgi:hypothetical protein